MTEWPCADSVNSPSNADLPEFLFSSASMTSSVTQRNPGLRSHLIVFAASQIECVAGGNGGCRAKLWFRVSANIYRRPRPRTCVNTGLEEPVWPSSEKSLSFALTFQPSSLSLPTPTHIRAHKNMHRFSLAHTHAHAHIWVSDSVSPFSHPLLAWETGNVDCTLCVCECVRARVCVCPTRQTCSTVGPKTQ